MVGATGARSIEVLGEVKPGMPIGRLKGGPAEGKLLVTKAGGFGTPSALAEALEYLTVVPECPA